MAAPRHGLGAHQYDALPLYPIDKVRQTCREFRGLHVVGKTAKRLVSPTPIRRIRARAPEAAQTYSVRIADAGGLKRHTKRVAVKLRIVARARYGTHVNKTVHRVGFEHIDKRFQGPRGMPHGQYNGLDFLLQHCSRVMRRLIYRRCVLASWEHLYGMVVPARVKRFDSSAQDGQKPLFKPGITLEALAYCEENVEARADIAEHTRHGTQYTRICPRLPFGKTTIPDGLIG